MVLVNGGCRRDQAASAELQAVLAGAPPDARRLHAAAVWRDVRAFYQKRQDRLVWVERDRPSGSADAALAALATAHEHAIDPGDYDLGSLAALHGTLKARGNKEKDRARDLARFDVIVTHALLTLGRDVAIGRTRPSSIEPRWKAHRTAPALVELLDRAIAEHALERWLERVRPPHQEYAGLQRAWKALDAKGFVEWPVVPGVVIKPGQRHAAVAVLRARFQASGELPREATADPQRYDPALQHAVQAFQEHHGLRPTGIVDAVTAAAINVPLRERRQQVAVNLERWRWLPDDLGAHHLRVNIPRFYLHAHENGKPVLDMRVVVGKVGDETPVFSAPMTHVVFSPYWNIPESIAADETLPAMARDPGFLARNNIEVVRISEHEAVPIDPDDVDWSDEDALKSVAFRQRPGATNALGFVKFMLPNPFNVYLHDTPSDGLFARTGRSFSHGCVRIEDPVGFAEYVLRDQPAWSRTAIEEAMHAGDEKHVKLTRQVPVHLLYFTAWTDELGGLHFRDDVYGFDRRQAAAMPRRGKSGPDGRAESARGPVVVGKARAGM